MKTVTSSNDRFAYFHSRIAEKSDRYDAAPVLIVALGDSLTQGYTAHATIDHENVYHARLKRCLEMAYPLATFSVINAGAAGQTVPDAMARLERDVLRHDPDLVIIGFGLNDAARGGLEGVATFKAELAAMIDQVCELTQADLIVLTPNFTLLEVNDNIHPDEAFYAPGLLPLQRGGVIGAYAAAIRDIGQHMNVPIADVYAAWERAAASGTNTDDWLANGLNHPTGTAHSIPARLLVNLISESVPKET
jgi:acyl-CoA thioesterase I